MNNEQDRLSFAQWVLERNLHWVGAAEVKTGVIVALNTAMLGGLAAAFGTTSLADHSTWSNLFVVVASVCLLAGLFCTTMSVLPRTDGPPSSFVYFGKVAKLSRADYVDSFNRAKSTDLLNDCLEQIHRNAEIASSKYQWVRSATVWSLLSVLPWIAAIAHLARDK